MWRKHLRENFFLKCGLNTEEAQGPETDTGLQEMTDWGGRGGGGGAAGEKVQI